MHRVAYAYWIPIIVLFAVGWLLSAAGTTRALRTRSGAAMSIACCESHLRALLDLTSQPRVAALQARYTVTLRLTAWSRKTPPPPLRSCMIMYDTAVNQVESSPAGTSSCRGLLQCCAVYRQYFIG